jgi:hypothetical protein
MQRVKKLPLIIVVLILILALGGIVAFKLIQERKPSEKTAIITPSAEQPSENPIAPLPVSEALINEQLENYLPQVLETNYNGQVFCTHHLYGYDEEKGTNMVKAYVWAYCEEYYLENGQLKMGSGVSEPVLVTLELENGALMVKSHQEPRDGELFAPSIREMFPANYAEEAIQGYPVEQLKPSPEEKASAYFE